MTQTIARKIAITGATAAAIVGVGTAALATSGSTQTSGSGAQPTSQSGQKSAKHDGKQRRHALRAALRRGLHGDVTTKGKDGYITHSAIRGAVTSVSATSVTVKAVDGFTKTYTLTKDTKVREHTPGTKGATAGTVSDLQPGDQVAVLGKAPEKSSAAPTATAVIDGLKKK